MKFSEALDEYLELRERGPDESSGYTDKSYYKRLEELRDFMDTVRSPVDADSSADAQWAPRLSEEVRALARQLDPECWMSYSGRDKKYKQAMDFRRTKTLNQVKAQLQAGG